MKPILVALTATLAAAGLLKILVIVVEPRLTFFPHGPIHQTPEAYGISFQEFSVPTSDGQKLHAWYLERPESRAQVVLFHGNAGNISAGWLEVAVHLFRHGFSVFTFDYRGFGRSTGSPTEAGLYEDSRSVARFFSTLRNPSPEVIYFGSSLGGVMASCALQERPPDGLVLEATFPDKSTLLSFHSPLLRLLGAFSRYRLDTLSFLRSYRGPVLVLHGDADRVVPVEAGKDLFERLESPQKSLLVVPGGSHSDLAEVGQDSYWTTLLRFADQLREKNAG